ncbi:hypothetical protein J6590_053379 [Homalodisca vitripennis]|nr:hypothetical protein J6590_053379 [Homalodisca vitripennis]
MMTAAHTKSSPFDNSIIISSYSILANGQYYQPLVRDPPQYGKCDSLTPSRSTGKGSGNWHKSRSWGVVVPPG